MPPSFLDTSHWLLSGMEESTKTTKKAWDPTELKEDPVPHVGEVLLKISAEVQKAEHLKAEGSSRS